MARKVALILLIIACILWVGFIFSNSLDNGSESTDKSQDVTEFINDVATSIGIQKPVSHKFVRNMAHFFEFAVLAVLSASTVSVFAYPRVHQHTVLALATSLLSLPFCALIAIIDESIQKFSQGRASQLADVLLDSCGALCGIALFTISYLVFIIIRDRKNNIYK